MRRYRTTFPLDEAEVTDGDDGFVGVNMRLPAHLLPPGYAAAAKNKVFDRGKASTRLGMQKLAWSNRTISVTFTADAASDVVTTTTAHKLITGDPVGLVNIGGSLPTGLNAVDFYFARVLTTTTLTLHQSAGDATANTNISNITSGGSGTHSLFILRPLPFDAVYGAGIFRDPDDLEWVVVAADDAIYRFREGNTATEIPIPPGHVVNYPVFFVQAVSDLLMFRGAPRTPWTMSNVDEGFADVGQTANAVTGASTENPVDGTATIPNADNALFMANRLCVPHSRDLVAVSDLLNYTRYQPVRSNFRIQQGTEDKIVTLFKFNETSVIVAKERSIYIVSNIYGNLTDARLDELTREYGCKAAKSFAQVGSDVWFLADRRGVSSIGQTADNKLQAVDLPVSDPIQPLIDRIKWSAAHNSVAAYYDNKYFLAVPLDAAEVTRASLVAAGTNYGADGRYSMSVKKGRKYRYTQGTNEKNQAGRVINGIETLTADGDFTAQAASIELAINSSLLYDNFEGENSGVAKENYTGWTNWNVLAGGGCDLISPEYYVNPFPAEGMYVDLIGTADSNYSGYAASGLESKTTFTIKANRSYVLTYKLGGATRNVTAPSIVTVSLGTIFTLMHSINDNAPMTTFTNNITVQPTDVSVKLKIAHNAVHPADHNYGAFLAEVSLYEVTSAFAINATLQPLFTEVNNGILVYDFLNKAWTGHWDGDAVMVKEFLKHTFNGVTRLFFASEDGFVNLVGEGFEDQIAENDDDVVTKGISDELLTRGYQASLETPKRFQQWEIQQRTWAPRFSITAQFDGVGETMALRTNSTKSRTKYYKPFDKADYVTTNVNNDHATAWRQDYSVKLTNSSTSIAPGSAGINPELHQDALERGNLGRTAKCCQLKIANTEGRNEIQSVRVSARSPQRRQGVHV